MFVTLESSHSFTTVTATTDSLQLKYGGMSEIQISTMKMSNVIEAQWFKPY